MKTIQLILVALLLLCLAPMPYGYYQLLRFVAMVAFGWMAYGYYVENKEKLMVTFGALALLFQPFIKVALGRGMWNIVDVAVAALLLFLSMGKKEKIKR